MAYPLGLKGVVVGEGDSYEQALADCESAIRFHLETFGSDGLETDSPVLEAFIAEAHAKIWTQAGISRDAFLQTFARS
jgi:predicted RNase H-like HicB family nuclease